MSASNSLLWNVALAMLWALALGNLSLRNVGIGFILGLAILFFARRAIGTQIYIDKIQHLFRLAAYFLRDLLVANLRVAYDVVTPTHHMRPSVLAIPLDVESDGEITLLANLITLTPGTLSLDVSADRKVLYIHSTYTPDADALRKAIKSGLETRILKVTR